MHVLIKNRQEGKTTQLMKWVSDGVPLDGDGYPFWSRVAVVADARRFENVRKEYWSKIKDFDHRVFTLNDIRHGRFINRKTAYRLDDMDVFIQFFFPGFRIDGFTMTADIWEEVEI